MLSADILNIIGCFRKKISFCLFSSMYVRGQVKLNRFIFSDHLPLKGGGGDVSGN